MSGQGAPRPSAPRTTRVGLARPWSGAGVASGWCPTGLDMGQFHADVITRLGGVDTFLTRYRPTNPPITAITEASPPAWK